MNKYASAFLRSMLLIIKLVVLLNVVFLLGFLLVDPLQKFMYLEWAVNPNTVGYLGLIIGTLLFLIGAYWCVIRTFPSMNETWKRKTIAVFLLFLFVAILFLLAITFPVGLLTVLFAFSFVLGGPGGF
ncbi:MAG: hypothetical protein Greene101449_1408 [Candidatus Peregrinibacteria bacterium Greene1014_49]|nr:MAG: hypothetical protein Greene101449_1408 [Candidatus Peregrinibacteria bacterium Greene1014_49]